MAALAKVKDGGGKREHHTTIGKHTTTLDMGYLRLQRTIGYHIYRRQKGGDSCPNTPPCMLNSELRTAIARMAADNIISTVKYTVEDQTGLEVENVNIFVDGVRVDN